MTMDDAVNYGATGATIGHEMTHGFDSDGRKFDADGNLAVDATTEFLRKFMNAFAAWIERTAAR